MGKFGAHSALLRSICAALKSSQIMARKLNRLKHSQTIFLSYSDWFKCDQHGTFSVTVGLQFLYKLLPLLLLPSSLKWWRFPAVSIDPSYFFLFRTTFWWFSLFAISIEPPLPLSPLTVLFLWEWHQKVRNSVTVVRPQRLDLSFKGSCVYSLPFLAKLICSCFAHTTLFLAHCAWSRHHCSPIWLARRSGSLAGRLSLRPVFTVWEAMSKKSE